MFHSKDSVAATNSMIFNQNSFDKAFNKDLRSCNTSLVIESPFIRLNRIRELLPVLTGLRRRNVLVIINTREPSEHDCEYMMQAEEAIAMMQGLGVRVLYTVKHHRKLAIIDRSIVWEGSLNILSYFDSCEIMRRTVSNSDADILLNFIGLAKYLKGA